jgi:3-oxoacyl-[acyl-carrier protein] reductase
MMSSSRLLENKVVFITGCNRGIGSAMLQTFVDHGAIVYAAARDESAMTKIISSISSEAQSRIFAVYFDLTDGIKLKETFLKIKKEQNRLDCVVNNAGIMKNAPLGMISDTDIEQTFSINVNAVINTIQLAVRLMRSQKSGSIINIASIVALTGGSGQALYSASKGAVVSLTMAAARELAPYNIRVNALSPGIINTELLNSFQQPQIKNMISKIGMGRLGRADEVANVAVFLASDLSEYVTGQIIGIDGGAVL